MPEEEEQSHYLSKTLCYRKETPHRPHPLSPPHNHTKEDLKPPVEVVAEAVGVEVGVEAVEVEVVAEAVEEEVLHPPEGSLHSKEPLNLRTTRSRQDLLGQ